jgi:hypothetical protein
MNEWDQVKTTMLPRLNDELKRANKEPISISEIERGAEDLVSR